MMHLENRVQELEEELKETRKTVSQLSETMGTLTRLLSNKLIEQSAETQTQVPNRQDRKLVEFMERMEARAKRQEDLENILVEKMRGQEEIMAEIKKNGNGTNLEIGMLQKQMNLLQKTQEDTEGIVVSKISEILENTIGQWETRLVENKNTVVPEEWRREKEEEQQRKIEEEKKKAEEKEFRMKVDSLLTGLLKSNSIVITRYSGAVFSFEKLQYMLLKYKHAFSVTREPLWILTPQYYVAEARIRELENELKAAKSIINQLNETVKSLTGLLNRKIDENRLQTGMAQEKNEAIEKKTQSGTKELRRKSDVPLTVDDVYIVNKRMRQDVQMPVENIEVPEVILLSTLVSPEPKENDENDAGDDKQREEENEFRRKVDSLLDGDLEVLKKRIFTKNFEIFFEDGVSFSFNDFENAIKKFQKSPNADFKYGLKVLQNPLWILTPENYEVECWYPKCRKITDLKNFRDEGLVAQCTGCYELILLGQARAGFEWVEADPCAHILQIKKGEIPKECETCEEEIARITYDWNECIRTPRRKMQRPNLSASINC